ncbi:hypothetical protein GOL26_28750 [Sinorhizobium medicae]|nr:hypothetical protein [Sinorhizobium medicae]MDX0998863.1 hypothetical protein [Sinorhizobium medicae]MDX1182808.1 hypothetical protein [Sinorhizobium medicae]
MLVMPDHAFARISAKVGANGAYMQGFANPDLGDDHFSDGRAALGLGFGNLSFGAV